MNITRFTISKIFLLTAVIFLAGCSLNPAAIVAPTADPKVVAETVSAAETEAVQSVYQTMTQSAALTPSATSTPLPTNTPLPTATPQVTSTPLTIVTATSTPITPTATIEFNPSDTPTLAPRSLTYQCSVISQKPTYGAIVKNNADFDLKVTLKNTGKNSWKSSEVDFEYLDGAEFQKRGDAVSLPNNVATGESVTIIVDMTAKVGTGVKSADWGLVRDGDSFCDVGVVLLVK